MTDQATPAKVRLTDGLGPMPASRRHCHDAEFSAEQMRAYALAERNRIKAAVFNMTLWAENCDDDGPEVDTARKSLACTILAAIAGYEAPPPVGTTGSLFGA